LCNAKIFFILPTCERKNFTTRLWWEGVGRREGGRDGEGMEEGMGEGKEESGEGKEKRRE
jgi:hypothetical protein